MERIRRRLAAEHAELTGVGLRSDFDMRAPWDTVFREAARENEFWSREVDKKVIQFTTAQKTKQDLVDPGFGDLRFATGGGPGREQGRARTPRRRATEEVEEEGEGRAGSSEGTGGATAGRRRRAHPRRQQGQEQEGRRHQGGRK